MAVHAWKIGKIGGCWTRKRLLQILMSVVSTEWILCWMAVLEKDEWIEYKVISLGQNQ